MIAVIKAFNNSFSSSPLLRVEVVVVVVVDWVVVAIVVDV